MKKNFLTIFLFLISFTSLADLYQKFSVPFSESSPDLTNKKTAIVLGAGPAGLIAAQTILQTSSYFDLVLIVEKRQDFSRVNMVNFFPENWAMLKKINVYDTLQKIAVKTDYFSFNFSAPDKNESFEASQEERLESFDFSKSLDEIFSPPNIGLSVFSISELQHALALKLKESPKVHFFHGEAEVSKNPNNDGFHNVTITLKQDSINLTPDLIIVAEGAHSKNRDKLGMTLKPMLKKQLWCSGFLTVENFPQTDEKGILLTEELSDSNNIFRTFAIFNINNTHIFLNGQSFSPGETVEDCLVRNARQLINRYYDKKNLVRSIPQQSKMKASSSSIMFDITPSRATAFTKSNNVILFGDAAGYATPKGGIGLSLITSTYPQALMDLLNTWQIPNRTKALNAYANRVEEIVHYWIERVASDDKVF